MADDLAPGTLVGRYRIGRRLGGGGMGTVYEAHDPLGDRAVAIKVLAGPLAGHPSILRRFVQEARSAGKLFHANVVVVHDVGRSGETDFIVMERVEGESAHALLARRGPLPWPEATRIAADACRGLIAAHAVGLVHRDVKPANILCAADGTAKIADFGLVKRLDAERGASMTGAGMVLGTPNYMSPEQSRGEAIDARTDVYSLGATYYHLLTGRPPYSAKAEFQVLFAHCSSPIPDPRDVAPEVPEASAAIVRRAMAKLPADRYSGAHEMLADLERLLRSARPPAPRARPVLRRWAAALAACGAVAALGIGLRSGRTPDAPRQTPPVEPPVAPAHVPAAPSFSPDGEVRALAFHPDGRTLAVGLGTGGEFKGVHLFDLESGLETGKYRTWKDGVALAWSTGGDLLASGGGDSLIWLRSADGIERALDEETDLGYVLSLDFSPDSTRLAVGYNRRHLDAQAVCVRVWDLESGSGRVFEGLAGGAHEVAFSPDGRLLAAANWGASIRIWEVAGGAVSRAIPQAPCDGLAWSTSGAALFLATGSSIRTLDVATGAIEPLGSAPSARLAKITISADGSLLATAGDRGRVWDARTGALLAEFEGHPGDVGSVAFAPGGGYLATGGKDGTVRFWRVPRR